MKCKHCNSYYYDQVIYLLKQYNLQQLSIFNETLNTIQTVEEFCKEHKESCPLGPCQCQVSYLQMTSSKLVWCVCSPKTTLIAAIEKTIRDGKTNYITYQEYEKFCNLVRFCLSYRRCISCRTNNVNVDSVGEAMQGTISTTTTSSTKKNI